VIGARTSESQTHRELASGLDLPVGFKNGSEGNVRVARDAMVAARAPASYVGMLDDGSVGAVHTRGNPDLHLVLRGGSEPNYAPQHVRGALSLVADQGIARPVLVDCSHGNSGKDHTRQAHAVRSVLAQVAAGETGICGLMLESHLKPGRQELRPGRPLEYGVSITDACIDWPETERLLYEAAAVARGRGTLAAAAAGGA
jgi:3-deoxy-7-phosphoheptulonate synthase